MREAFGALFSPEYMGRTVVNSLLFTVSIVGLWAGSIYVPTAVTQIAVREGYGAAAAGRLASYGSMVLSIATIAGCLMAPWLAERLGRKRAMALYFVVLGVAVAIAFGYVFYMASALTPFFVMIFFLGIGGANFALYTLWLPEQYSTGCRASAIAFVSSVGRFVGVAMVFLVANAIRSYGSLGVPVAVTALAFVLGVILVMFAVETKASRSRRRIPSEPSSTVCESSPKMQPRNYESTKVAKAKLLLRVFVFSWQSALQRSKTDALEDRGRRSYPDGKL